MSTSMPCFVVASSSSQGVSPGSSDTFDIRTSGIRAQPSARAAPDDASPSAPADSREVRYPTKTPSRTTGVDCAATPSSS